MATGSDIYYCSLKGVSAPPDGFKKKFATGRRGRHHLMHIEAGCWEEGSKKGYRVCTGERCANGQVIPHPESWDRLEPNCRFLRKIAITPHDRSVLKVRYRRGNGDGD